MGVAVLITSCKVQELPEPVDEKAQSPLVMMEGTQGVGNDNGYYYFKSISEKGLNISYLDYETSQNIVLCNRPECQHFDETCSSYLTIDGRGRILFLLNEKLGMLSCGDDSGDQRSFPSLTLMDLNGDNEKTICTLKATQSAQKPIAVDDKNIFVILQDTAKSDSGVETVFTLVKINCETGEMIELYKSEKQIFLLGNSDDELFIKIFSPASGVFMHEIWNVPVDTKKAPHKAFEWEHFKIISTINKNKLIYFENGSKDLKCYNLSDGLESVITTQLPDYTDNKGVSNMEIYRAFDGKIILSNFKYSKDNSTGDTEYYIVDEVSGDIKEFTLLSPIRKNAPLEILAQNKDYYTVVAGEKLVMQSITLPDGTLANVQQLVTNYGRILKEDYANSVSSYLLFDTDDNR